MPTYPIRRRPREVRVCTQCRAHKIRCDRKSPCSYCAKRSLTCSYDHLSSNPASAVVSVSAPSDGDAATTSRPTPPSLPVRHAFDGSCPIPGNARDPPKPDSPSENVTISQKEWDEINSKMDAMEQVLASLNSIFQDLSARKTNETQCDPSTEGEPSPPPEGIYGSNASRTGAVHIGSRSAFVDILDRSKHSEDTAEALPKDDLLAELALGNESAVYPFVDLWSSDPFTFNITAVSAMLPDDERCRMFLKFYSDIGDILYPVLGDTSAVEQNATRLLRSRLQAGGVYRPHGTGPVKPFGMSLSFLSLLFAVLASGCQLSDLPVKEREFTSWVYVSCAYQCLRMVNYVSQPSLEVVQVLLIISNVLSYNMNASASYTLLGMTERLCMVLGLHVESSGFPPVEQAIRRRVWWTMAFQNSHFSLAYDRPSITMVSQPEIPLDPKSMPGHRSYFETLSRVISLALDLLRARTLPGHSDVRYHEIRDYQQHMQRILAEATPHLRHRERCVTLRDHIERNELRLHSSYLLSVICRVSLDPDSHLDDQRRILVREDCIANLISTIDAFVELHSVNAFSSRSWISLQRTIASAFLLVSTRDGQCHPQTWDLIEKLEMALADHVYVDGAVHHSDRTDSATHLASSLRALREVNAAFRQKNMGPSGSETAQASVVHHPGIAVPGSTAGSPDPAVWGTAGYAQAQLAEDGNMRNILGRVSDVMIFPSMNGLQDG